MTGLVAALAVPLGALPLLPAAPAGAAEQAPPVSAPDELSALAAARQHSVRVEVLSRRGETIEVFANPDGSFSMSQHLRPAWARKGGQWVRPDATLEVRPDGSVAPRAATFAMSFSNGGGEATPFAKAERGGAGVELGVPFALPRPTLAGNVATYPEVMAGVDLQVVAETDGFTHLLVVKNRAAAANPAVREFTLRTKTRGGSFSVDNGAVSFKDARGGLVFGGAVPTMWDSGIRPDPAQRGAAAQGGRSLEVPPASGTPARREKPVVVTVDGDTLRVTPDAALLDDPDATYPIMIDPPFSGRRNHWLVLERTFNQAHYDKVNPVAGDATYGGLWAGHQSGFGETATTARTLLEFDTAQVRWTHILKARLRLFQAWSSKGCNGPNESGGEVRLHEINPFGSGDRFTTFAGWGQHLGSTWAVKRAGAGTKCAPDYVDFDLRTFIQNRATNGAAAAFVGLKAANESDPTSWKRYMLTGNVWDAQNPVLDIDYNWVPGYPNSVGMDVDTPCVEGDGRPSVNTATPQLSARVPDGDDVVRAQFELYRGTTKVDEYLPGDRRGNELVSVHVPTGKLTSGEVYRWRVRGYNVLPGYPNDEGPWSGWCEFKWEPAGAVNSPPPPTVTSTDFVAGDIGPIQIGQPGVVRFSPNGATDVVAYRYGWTNDSLSMTVRAAADGTATVPITMAHADEASLWVAAVDRAGNLSVGSDGTEKSGKTRFALQAALGSLPSARKRSDVNGDGRSDVLEVRHSGDRLQVWGFTARADGAGMHQPVLMLDAAGYSADKVKTVTGDFDGDGRTELAVLRDEGSARLTLWLSRSDGNAITMKSVSADFDSGPGGWYMDRVTPLAGDFNGDGTDEIAILYRYNDARTGLWSWDSGEPNAPPKLRWDSGVGFWEAWRTRAVVGDFDGDGFVDVSAFYQYENCQTGVFRWRSAGTRSDAGVSWNGFETPAKTHLSLVNQWCGERTTPVAGDFDKDGRSDLGAVYDYGSGLLRFWVYWARSGYSVADQAWVSSGPAWSVNDGPFRSGDHDGDGRDEMSLVFRCCGADQAVLKTWQHGGATFAAPVERWRGVLNPRSHGGVTFDPTARYQLVSRGGNKCLGVAAVASGQQLTLRCDATGTNDEFTIRPTGPAFVTMHPAASAGLCVDVSTSGPAQGAKVYLNGCNGGTNQAFRLEYRGQTESGEVFVRIRPLHSDRCVDTPSYDDGALTHQWDCHGGAGQDWYLRRVGP